MNRKAKLLTFAILGTLGLAACSGDSSPSTVTLPGGNPPPPPTNPPPAGNDPFPVSDVFTMGSNNRQIDPALNANGTPSNLSPSLQDTTFTFTGSSPDVQDPAFAISLGGNFVAVDYIGAFSQDTQDDWAQGWTVSLYGNNTVWEPASSGTLNGGIPQANGSCPADTTDIGDTLMPDGAPGMMDICQLNRRYDVDGSTLSLTNDNVYALASGFPGTYIGNGEAADGNSANDVNVTLDIEAGTLILGSPQEAMIITRGSQINAIGTAVDPIVFSSNDQFSDWVQGSDGTSGRGEWAGLALMGYAESNECGTPCDVAAEGNIGAYGGTNNADDSGTLEYVVVRHGGNDIDGNGNELNGLTYFGTGSGTNSSFIQVHKGLDDGVEHFGGSDHIDHLVLTDNRDDSFDWGQGYTGTAQFVVIRQAADVADMGIEADNDGTSPDAPPRSLPILANFTMIGQPNGDPDAGGLLLRRGTGAEIYNFIVTDFANFCLDVDGSATSALFGTNTGALQIHNTILYCPTGVDLEDDGDVDAADIDNWFASDPLNSTRNPNLQANGLPNPVAGSANSNFVSTDYIGAFAQDDPNNNWTLGWTVGVNGNNTVWAPAAGGTLAGGMPMADGVCPTGTTDIGDQALPVDVGGGMMDLCQLERRYGVDGTTLSLTNDNVYALASGFPGTYMGNGDAADGNSANDVSTTIEIEEGTLLLGSPQEALIITRGSQIQASGTAVDPIVMTSSTQFNAWVAGGDGSSGRGEWAGLALMGYAESNECGTPCDVAAEGNIGAYGGTDNDDSSGTLEYVVIRHAGNDIDGNGNELNVLTMFGTGSGTRASYVQTHMGLDDGIEHFGASDFMDHIVMTGNADDSFDWGQGYVGGAQFVLIIQAADDADRGIEADNDGTNPDAVPVSKPTLANMTMVGSGGGATDDTIGVLLRRGTGAEIWNTIITSFDACLDLDDDATFTAYTDGDIVMNNSVVNCPINFDEE